MSVMNILWFSTSCCTISLLLFLDFVLTFFISSFLSIYFLISKVKFY
jgi:hypothetical protein